MPVTIGDDVFLVISLALINILTVIILFVPVWYKLNKAELMFSKKITEVNKSAQTFETKFNRMLNKAEGTIQSYLPGGQGFDWGSLIAQVAPTFLANMSGPSSVPGAPTQAPQPQAAAGAPAEYTEEQIEAAKAQLEEQYKQQQELIKEAEKQLKKKGKK